MLLPANFLEVRKPMLSKSHEKENEEMELLLILIVLFVLPRFIGANTKHSLKASVFDAKRPADW